MLTKQKCLQRKVTGTETGNWVKGRAVERNSSVGLKKISLLKGVGVRRVGVTRSSFQIFEVLSGEREIRTVLCSSRGPAKSH